MSYSDSIAVVGAGTMGAGIALVGATSGMKSVQIDVSKEALDKARALHAKTLARNVQKKRMTQTEADESAARIEYADSLDAAAGATFAIEAASERLDLKKSIFAIATGAHFPPCSGVSQSLTQWTRITQF